MKKLFLWMIMVIITCHHILAEQITWSIDFSIVANQQFKQTDGICIIEFSCSDELSSNFKFANNVLRLPATSQINFEVTDEYQLDRINFIFRSANNEFRNNFIFSNGNISNLEEDYEFGGYNNLGRYWESSSPNTRQLLFTNGPETESGTCQLIGLEITYKDAEPEELPVGPVPVLKFDKIDNTISFEIPEGFTEDFLDRIYFCWMTDNSKPDKDNLVQYTAPYQLENTINYIWAMTKGNDEWQDSELIMVGQTKHKPKTDNPVIEYNNRENVFTLTQPNKDFKGYIEYFISDTPDIPSDESFSKYDDSPVQLTGTNLYIWARCVGDDDFTDSDLVCSEPTVYNPYLESPEIKYNFDETARILTLTVDNDNFNGIIEYYISSTEILPESFTLSPYTDQIILDNKECYVWARCSGDPDFSDSELTLVLKISPKILKDAPEISYKYNENENILYLLIEDETFNGKIEYWISDNSNEPTNIEVFDTYSESIKLQDTHNFVWYRTSGDNDFKDSELKYFEIIQRPLPPTPKLVFDPISNSFTLTNEDNFEGRIEYIILPDSKSPTPADQIQNYLSIVQLSNPVNYIWARCIGDNYRPTDFVFLQVTEKFEPADAPNVIFDFDEHHNIILLSVDNPSFKGEIHYCITSSTSVPQENLYIKYVDGDPIQLEGEKNYIWAYTLGDPDFKNSEPQHFTTEFKPLPPAPVPTFSFDEINNILTLSQNNSQFNGKIEYAISSSIDTPIEELEIHIYEQPIQLTSLANYVWARCFGDENFESGNLEFLTRTELLSLKEAPEFEYKYNERTGILELNVTEQEFKGNIAYIITERNTLHDDGVYEIYTEPIELKKEVNYIWIKTINDPNYKETDFVCHTFNFTPLPVAADPEMSFDKTTNTLTLFCPDNNFKGFIEYYVSTVNIEPEENIELIRYQDPIQLSEPTNYIWACCVGDPNFQDSKLKNLGRTEAITLLPAPTIDSSFNARKNILTLEVKDPNFKGLIEYFISDKNQMPTDYSLFMQYSEPIVLDADINYVWARTTSDANYKDSDPQLFKTDFEPLPAPGLTLSFDKRTNIITISHDDNEFEGVIKYCLMSTSTTPSLEGNFETYIEPFKATNDVNYVWAFSCDDKYYKDSDLKFLGMTEYRPMRSAPIINLIFDNINNTLSFAIADTEFKGRIMYIIGDNDNRPAENDNFTEYINTIILENSTNYIWYRSEGDEDYADSDLKMIKTDYKPLPIAPDPELKYDDELNSFTLFCSGLYDGDIEYCVTQSPEKPTEDNSLSVYTGTVALTADENYIWARCVGNNSFIGSELICVGHTIKKQPADAPEITVNYNDKKNIIELLINDSQYKGKIEYIITKVNAMPEEDADFIEYMEPVSLEGDKNYIWYRSIGDPEYKPGSILLYIAYYEPTTEPPVVEMNFDAITNSFTLSTPNSSFAGRIEYCVTATMAKPTAYSDIKTYESTVFLTETYNYIWARCVGDPNFKNTDWEFIGHTEFIPQKDSPEIKYNFDSRNNILSFTIEDTDYNGHIEYILSTSDKYPDDSAVFTEYSNPLELTGLENFVWYRCSGDSRYKDSEIMLVRTIFDTQQVAPVPVLKFDEQTNIMTLSIEDSTFNGKIEYYISDSETKPDDSVILLLYTDAVVLPNDISYIWARCTDDLNFIDSELTLLGVTRRKILKDSPEISIAFDDTMNIVSLSVTDDNYNGDIKYFIAQSDTRPDDDTEYETYSGPVQLYSDINYIWFFVQGDPDYKDSTPSMIKTVKRELFTAPVPILKFDPVANTFSLSVNDSEYNGYIEYWISQSANDPVADQKCVRYDGPVTLSANVNYIWARCAGDPNFKDSQLTFLMMTEAFVVLDAPEVTSSFDNRNNILTLTIDNREFKGHIEYILSESDQSPDDSAIFAVYSEPIKLVNRTNFIWYKTCGDTDFKDSELVLIKTTALPIAPIPELTFDELSNTMTLTVKDESFDGKIEYTITDSENKPDEISLFSYTGPVTLVNEENFIWARCAGTENFRDSELILLGHTKHKILKDAPVPSMKFNPLTNSFTLSLEDADFSGYIEYLISPTANDPIHTMDGIMYKDEVVLESIVNYIWARCAGDDDYKESSFILMGMTEAFVPIEAPEIMMNFNPYLNIVELSVSDETFYGDILFAITDVKEEPDENNFAKYESPIELENDINYIWAKTTGDLSYAEDQIHLIGETRALPYSPVPEIIFNPFMNTIEFKIPTDFEDSFNGKIFFAVTDNKDCPEYDSFEEYTGIISLVEEVNYIWAYTTGDKNYRNLIPKLIDITEISNPDYLQTMSFRLIPDGATLTEGEIIIITHHHNNSIYALGDALEDASHRSIYFPGKQLNYFTTSLEELNFYGIMTFVINNGHLMELNGENYLSPSETTEIHNSRAITSTIPFNTDFSATELSHILKINDLYLTGDSDGFRFSDQPGCITVYTTREDFTDAREILNTEGIETIYYNLQGLRVEDPSSGYYIEKKGSNVRKVYINKR